MPNWCDNQVEILAKEETIQWIAKHLNENAGRRCEEPATSLEFAFVYGDEVWYTLKICVRTSGSGFSDFLTLIQDKFRNIHIKGHYYIELMGGGDYEEGTDDDGKKYSFFWELPIDDYCDYDEYLSEIPTEDELFWDQERVNDLDMWYYITGSTNPNERDNIECDLWDMYHWSRIWWSEHNDGNGIPAPSGMGYMYMIDFNGKFIIEDEYIPEEEELMMDDVRKDNSSLYERALDLGWKPLNYGHWEEIEWCAHHWECTEEKQKEFDEEFPTEEWDNE